MKKIKGKTYMVTYNPLRGGWQTSVLIFNILISVFWFVYYTGSIFGIFEPSPILFWLVVLMWVYYVWATNPNGTKFPLWDIKKIEEIHYKELNNQGGTKK